MSRGISAWQSSVSEGLELILQSSACRCQAGTGWAGAHYKRLGAGGAQPVQKGVENKQAERGME